MIVTSMRGNIMSQDLNDSNEKSVLGCKQTNHPCTDTLENLARTPHSQAQVPPTRWDLHEEEDMYIQPPPQDSHSSQQRGWWSEVKGENTPQLPSLPGDPKDSSSLGKLASSRRCDSNTMTIAGDSGVDHVRRICS
jgi:hypothetical protein